MPGNVYCLPGVCASLQTVRKRLCVSLGEYYLKKDAVTYQDITSTIGYTTQTQKIDERKLAGSTVWRWLGFFGSLKNTLRNALEIIRQAAPNSTVFRQMSPIHPKSIEAMNEKSSLSRHFNCSPPTQNIRIFGVFNFPRLGNAILLVLGYYYLQHLTKEVICEIERRKMGVILV